MTFGEYSEKLKGHEIKLLRQAQLIGLGFNDPRKLNELIMLQEAINRGEG